MYDVMYEAENAFCNINKLPLQLKKSVLLLTCSKCKSSRTVENIQMAAYNNGRWNVSKNSCLFTSTVNFACFTSVAISNGPRFGNDVDKY
jgi:hypothetical protein